jgi:hypothetical protein
MNHKNLAAPRKPMTLNQSWLFRAAAIGSHRRPSMANGAGQANPAAFQASPIRSALDKMKAPLLDMPTATHPAAAPESVFRDRHSMVFRAADPFTRNATGAGAENVQTVLLRLPKREPAAEPVASIASFLQRAALNAAVDLMSDGLMVVAAPKYPGEKRGPASPLDALGSLKPSLIAAYAEPERITFAANGDLLGPALASLMRGDIAGAAGSAIPFFQSKGTRPREMSYR